MNQNTDVLLLTIFYLYTIHADRRCVKTLVRVYLWLPKKVKITKAPFICIIVLISIHICVSDNTSLVPEDSPPYLQCSVHRGLVQLFNALETSFS